MRIFFSGIGGVGIGPLAMLAFDAGHFVLGSDVQASEMTETLKSKGALVQIVKEGSYLQVQHEIKPVDWFVYTSALPKDHPDIVYAKENGIKMSKRDGYLNEFLKEKNLKMIAVSGTHGKTTTTGMLIWLFKQLGVPVSYSIGTTISFGPAAQYQKASEYFVYECDEFDRNFLNFHPELSLIPSLDYDHADTYPTPEDYLAAFNQFVTQSKQAVAWQSSADTLSEHENMVVVSDDTDVSGIKLAGDHTRRNAWLALTATKLALKDIPQDELIQKLSAFPGTNRRFEKLAENIYTDYAHHPVEIAATIQMAKELNQNVVIVYQPHQNIRQHEILEEGGYQDCFNGAKKVYWLPTYLSREYKDLPLLSAEEIAKSASDGSVIELANLDDVLSQKIQDHAKNGDLVVAMSAGDLDDWLRESVIK